MFYEAVKTTAMLFFHCDENVILKSPKGGKERPCRTVHCLGAALRERDNTHGSQRKTVEMLPAPGVQRCCRQN